MSFFILIFYLFRMEKRKNPPVYLELYQTSMMEFFCKNSSQWWVFVMVLTTSLTPHISYCIIIFSTVRVKTFCFLVFTCLLYLWKFGCSHQFLVQICWTRIWTNPKEIQFKDKSLRISCTYYVFVALFYY